jgi:hypothetical protein
MFKFELAVLVILAVGFARVSEFNAATLLREKYAFKFCLPLLLGD